VLVCTIGDLTLDVSIQLTAALAEGGDTNATISLAPGGQAANVAAWVASLGAEARCIAKRGADTAGQLARAGLERRGVDVVGPTEGRNAIICSLVALEGERSMASDRATATTLRSEEIDPTWLEDCDHLFVSGYALLEEPARGAALHSVELARARGANVSVDLASWSGIEKAGAGEIRTVLARLRPDVVFGNEAEERALGGPMSGATRILKRGARGCSFDTEQRSALPVAHVVDSTGAGDALAAGWIVGGPDLALEAAAHCVAKLGSLP